MTLAVVVTKSLAVVSNVAQFLTPVVGIGADWLCNLLLSPCGNRFWGSAQNLAR
jgi:hypothetical protein